MPEIAHACGVVCGFSPCQKKGDLGEYENLKELSTNRRVKGQHCQSIPSLKLCGETNCFWPPTSQLSVTGDEHSFCSDPWENPLILLTFMPSALGPMPVSLLRPYWQESSTMIQLCQPDWISPEHHGEVMRINTTSLLPTAASILMRDPRNCRLLMGACSVAAVVWELW